MKKEEPLIDTRGFTTGAMSQQEYLIGPNRSAGFHLLVNSTRITDKETLEKKAKMVKEIEKYMQLDK